MAAFGLPESLVRTPLESSHLLFTCTRDESLRF